MFEIKKMSSQSILKPWPRLWQNGFAEASFHNLLIEVLSIPTSIAKEPFPALLKMIFTDFQPRCKYR